MMASATQRIVASYLISVMVLAGCVTERAKAPTLPEGNYGTVEASGPVPLPDVVVGRSTDPSTSHPCLTAFGLVDQILQIPQIELQTRPDYPARYRAQTNDAFYSYSVTPVDPATCAIMPPAVPYVSVYFGFVHLHDKNLDGGLPGCADSSFVSLYQFETPVHGAIIKPYFRSTLWERIDSLPAIGGRCATWQPPPNGVLEWP